MVKQGGSLPRGRRLRHEVATIPDANDLSDLDARAQRALGAMVEKAGGRFDSKTAIAADHVELLTELLDTWGRRYATHTETGLYFGGQPGLWHAFDQLYPLQDPNRWDRLRAAVVIELEKGSWRRRRPPRGIGFDIGG